MLNIPLSNDARQEFTTRLNNQKVRITLWYQDTGAGWYMSLEIIEGDMIITGARVVSGVPMLTGLITSFIGDLIAVPTITPTTEPARDAWNNTHQFVFVTPDELESLDLEIIQA